MRTNNFTLEFCICLAIFGIIGLMLVTAIQQKKRHTSEQIQQTRQTRQVEEIFKTIKGPMYVGGHLITIVEYVETKEQFIFSDVAIVKINAKE